MTCKAEPSTTPRTKPSPEALARAYAALRAWWATENGKAAIARVKARREAQNERTA